MAWCCMGSAGIVADDVTITALLRVLAHAGRWEEALQVRQLAVKATHTLRQHPQQHVRRAVEV